MIYTKKTGTMTIAVSGTSTTGKEIVSGELGAWVVKVPALTGTGTITAVGTDDIGGTIYGIGTITESKVSVIPPVGTPTYFDGTINFTIEETSGTQDAAANITYNLYYGAKQG